HTPYRTRTKSVALPAFGQQSGKYLPVFILSAKHGLSLDQRRIKSNYYLSAYGACPARGAPGPHAPPAAPACWNINPPDATIRSTELLDDEIDTNCGSRSPDGLGPVSGQDPRHVCHRCGRVEGVSDGVALRTEFADR